MAKHSAIPRSRSGRKEAFARLSERFRDRSRADDAPTDLELAMEGQPTVTNGLKEAPGGLPAVLNALRAFDNPDAQAFMSLHDSLSVTDRRYLTLEEIAVAADVGSSRLLGLAAEALNAYGTSVAQIILWAAMPKIVKKSVRNAMVTRGIADREMMLKAAAVLPIPKGSQIAIQQVNQLPPPPTEAKALPPWNQESHLRAIQDAYGDSQLPVAKPPHEPLPSVLDAMQARTTDALEEQ